MIANEAREIGYRIITLDPTPDSPCGQLADEQILGAFDDLAAAQQLAQKADVITYEFENISPEIAKELEQHSHLPQGYQLLYTTQNRVREKRAIEAAGVKVAPYAVIESYTDLVQATNKLGYPCVLKTTEGGYDGKGQLVLHSAEDLELAKQLLKEAQMTLILEAFVPYVKEISVIVARNGRGDVQTFPVAENIHQENILHVSIAPARITLDYQDQARQLALQLAQHVELVGLLAIEMFVLENGEIYVNELAPRPHNSGHYTQQGCYTSQFEQHVRAVCNLPLGSTELLHPTVMVNILGEHVEPVREKMAHFDPAIKTHFYGKKEAKVKRKMGHLNVSKGSIADSLAVVNELGIWPPIE
ncbi:5-(carboxyamino)imidazole ribonucleotide synthase [Bacillus horti]